jgi:NADH-quinone oxidoreductase subunit E
MMTDSAKIIEVTDRREKIDATQVVDGILQSRNGQRGGLIAILEEVQDQYGYLPEEALRALARQTGQSLVDVYGVATFYRSFSLQPRGRSLISVCLGTACHVRGGPMVVEAFERRLGIHAGETTPDGEFTLETVNCLGACALGPIVVVDGQYFSKVTPAQVGRILKKIRAVPAPVVEEEMELAQAK